MGCESQRRSLSFLQSKVNVTFLRGSQDACRPVGVTGLLPALSFTEGLVIDFISTEMSRGLLPWPGAQAGGRAARRCTGPTLIISLWHRILSFSAWIPDKGSHSVPCQCLNYKADNGVVEILLPQSYPAVPPCLLISSPLWRNEGDAVSLPYFNLNAQVLVLGGCKVHQ